MNIAVLASGRGSNFLALADALPASGPGRIALVISNREEAPVLASARERGIAARTIGKDGTDAGAILGLLAEHRIGLVVLAGYLKRVPDAVVAAYRGRVLNVHPALLPAFGGAGMYGHRVHEAVIASGVRISGVTVHVVDEQYDHGPVLAQWPVPVRAGDTPDALAERVLAVEHRLLPAAVLAACRDMAASGAPPRPLAARAEAFILGDAPEPALDHALVPA